MSKGGQTYTYGGKPHAVTGVGSTTYVYDANGNMTTRGSQTLTWDAENSLTSVNTSPTTTFVYDGDGKREKRPRTTRLLYTSTSTARRI